jgi:hypothetical protein
MERVAGGWQRHELSLETPGWRFDDDNQLWSCETRDA